MTIKKNLRRFLKHRLGQYNGYFHYFNTKVFFRKNSLIFDIACEQGIYDKEVFDFIFSFLQDGSLLIDVGTNIGLLSIPVLANYSHSEVISFEPSSNVLPFLMRTHNESTFKNRWKIVNKALGKENGKIEFKINRHKDSAFDSISNQNEIKSNHYIYDVVDIVKLDEYLNISPKQYNSIVLKIDVEGFELEVLYGAIEFIKQHKPYIIIEIVKDFLSQHETKAEDFIDFINEVNYNMYALTTLNPITNVDELFISLPKNLNFAFLPKK